MNRIDLQKLSRLRLVEAKALLAAGHREGAYYLAGYAVECALKACIARTVRRYDFPDKKLVADSYTHDLGKLVRLAGLERELDEQSRADPAFAAKWAIVKDWSEESRYATDTANQAADLVAAITDRSNGVLRSIRSHW
jgi:hypothetical protein